MKKYTTCTAGQALDAQKNGKHVEFSTDSFNFLPIDWNERFFEYDNFRIVEEVSDPEPPKLPKYAGWMWARNGSPVLYADDYWYGYCNSCHDIDEMKAFESSGEIVPPSVWGKQ